MNRIERLSYIESIISKTGYISIQELVDQTGVTDVTVRHDLQELEHQGIVSRSYGGAYLCKSKSEDVSSSIPVASSLKNYDLKSAVGKAAISFIQPGEIIFIGGGSTPYIFATFIQNKADIQIVTTNINVAQLLPLHKNNLYFIGGELICLNGIYYSNGYKVSQELEQMFIDKAFVGVSGVDIKAGFTISNANQLNMYQSIMKIAKEVIIILDRTKLGLQCVHQLSLSSNVSTVITNSPVDDIYIDKFKALGLHLITV